MWQGEVAYNLISLLCERHLPVEKTTSGLLTPSVYKIEDNLMNKMFIVLASAPAMPSKNSY